jgi:hypothetical protein
LPPVSLALVRQRNGRLIMAQGEDSEHLKIGREVYLRRIDGNLTGLAIADRASLESVLQQVKNA